MNPVSPVCPRFLGLHRGSSCQCFLSLVERRELCRYTSGSASVARLAPCPICLPSPPARYALGVGERYGGWSATQGHTIPPLRLRPHQRLARHHLLCPISRLAQLSRVRHHGEVCPLSRPVMLSISDVTGIFSIAEKPSLPPRSHVRIAIGSSFDVLSLLQGAIRIYPVPLS
jgi:hypothetical protein